MSVFKHTSYIDKHAYGYNYKYPITPNKAKSWFLIEKDIYTFIKNAYTNEIIAYINAIPVSDETYNKFKNGDIQEYELNDSHICPFTISDSYNLIVLSVAIKNGLNFEDNTIHTGRISEFLLLSCISKLNNYNKDKCKINKMGAFAWSAQGINLCKGFCMIELPELNKGFKYYELDFKK